MRFRRLGTEELCALEPEFKQFLIIHELYNEEWQKLAEESPKKAEEIIELFSDVVLEKVYQEISFLVHFSTNLVSFFDVRSKLLKAYHIKSSADLTLDNEDTLNHALTSKLGELTFYKGQKKLSEKKADEVFKLIQKGCESCDEAFFNHYYCVFDVK